MTTEKDQDLLDLQTTDSFRLYLDEVGRHPLLTKEDEIELSQAYEAGLAARAKLKELAPGDKGRAGLQVTADLGERARRKMIESNLRLVVSIARRFSATGLPLGDLVQEGNLGLLRAVEKFDWRKGFKFSTYATWWIRQSVERAVMNQGRVIRLPVHVVRELQQVLRARRTLENDPAFAAARNGFEGEGVRVEDVAALLGREVQEVAELLAMAETPKSLDAVMDRSDDEHTLGDSMADELTLDPTGVTQNHEVERLLNNWIDALSSREREVLEGRFGLHDREPETLEVLSDRLGLTRERVRQIQNEALLKLKRFMVRNGISKQALF